MNTDPKHCLLRMTDRYFSHLSNRLTPNDNLPARVRPVSNPANICLIVLRKKVLRKLRRQFKSTTGMQQDYESEKINSIARSDPSERLDSDPLSGSSKFKK
jgi:hypothetical protein